MVIMHKEQVRITQNSDKLIEDTLFGVVKRPQCSAQEISVHIRRSNFLFRQGEGSRE